MSDNVHTNGRLCAFAYLNAEKAGLYRAIMGVFAEAKGRFVLHLGPGDICEQLRMRPGLPPVGAEELEAALAQLCAWGNLQFHPDTSSVTTLEEFYRPRKLYQLTRQGQAVEAACSTYVDNVHESGRLQTTALSDIRESLRELAELASSAEPAPVRVHRVFAALCRRFDELTSRAHSFLNSVQRAVELQGVERQLFLAYKQTLIEYLERFVGELIVATADITERLQQLDDARAERLVEIAANRDLADAFNPADEDRARASRLWQSRWQGLRRWFLRDGNGPSQAELLRARARAAVSELLRVVARINEQRVTRSDRVADLRMLARWFAETDSDREAHRLWRAAFALSGSRHHSVDAETLDRRASEPVQADASWIDSPPLFVSPRLRRVGRHPGRGPARGIVDFSRQRSELAGVAAREAEQLAAARKRLATGRQMRLSEVKQLDPQEFSLFLDILGEALARKVLPDDVVETTSTDGSLVVRLIPTGDDHVAVVHSSAGTFSGSDHLIVISNAFVEADDGRGQRLDTDEDRRVTGGAEFNGDKSIADGYDARDNDDVAGEVTAAARLSVEELP